MKLYSLLTVLSATALASEPQVELCRQITLAKTSLNVRFSPATEDGRVATVFRNATKLYELKCETGAGVPKCSGADERGNPTTFTHWTQSAKQKKVPVGQLQVTQGDEEPIQTTSFLCE